MYRPDEPAPYPTIVFFHGGGVVLGSIATHEWLCRHLARETGAVAEVASDLREAIGHPL